METIFLRTPLGNMEIAARKYDLTRWQRATLIVIGTGKPLAELEHELRRMPEKLARILHALAEKGLVTSSADLRTAHAALPAAPALPDSLKQARRYLSYLIGTIENTDPTTALKLAIQLKKAASEHDIAALRPAFLENLRGIRGQDEAQRLLEKLVV